jgi:hypothetical protein
MGRKQNLTTDYTDFRADLIAKLPIADCQVRHNIQS